MDGSKAILAAVIVAVVLAGGVTAMQYASQGTATTYEATDTVETNAIGDRVAVNNSSEERYFSDQVTVETSNNKILIGDGVDYDWSTDNGTLVPQSDRAANATLTVDYTFGSPTETQGSVSALWANIYTMAAWFPLIIVAALGIFAAAKLGGKS